jgi:chromate transport protein ChrA
LAVLLGRELRGTRGIIVSVLAFLSPTFVATVSLAWGYTRIQNLPATQNALRFVIPTTAGLGFATAYRMAVPLLKRTAMVAVIGLALASLVGVILTLPVFAVLVGAGLTGAIGFFVTEHRTSKWNRENGMGTWTRGEANDE